MKAFRKWVRAIFKVGGYILVCYFKWMIKYSFNPIKYPIEERFAKVQELCRRVLKAFDVNYYIEGEEEFLKSRKPGENTLFICNHLAEIDPLVIIAVAKSPVSFVAKKEAGNLPFVGRLIKIIDGYFIDREDLRSSLITIHYLEEKLRIQKNLDYVIFAEGTRNRFPLTPTAPFHNGSFKPGMKNHLNVSLLMMYGEFRILTKTDKELHIPVHIHYMKTFTYEDYKDMNTVELATASHLYYINNIDRIRKMNDEELAKLN